MKTTLVLFYAPSDVMDVTEETTNEEIKKWCFRVRKYSAPEQALMAYADTPCFWSTLKDASDNIQDFIDEAFEHILKHDEDWLYENFT